MKLAEKFNIKGKKVEALKKRIFELGIELKEIEETAVRGSGRGGQKVNKTSNKVQLKHIPSGITVACQRERERNKNRFIALRELVDKYEMIYFPKRSKRIQEIDKIRKQKAKKRKRSVKKHKT